MAFGIFENASLVGANRVIASERLSVSASPALVTAVTRVDSAGV